MSSIINRISLCLYVFMIFVGCNVDKDNFENKIFRYNENPSPHSLDNPVQPGRTQYIPVHPSAVRYIPVLPSSAQYSPGG